MEVTPAPVRGPYPTTASPEFLVGFRLDYNFSDHPRRIDTLVNKMLRRVKILKYSCRDDLIIPKYKLIKAMLQHSITKNSLSG